MAIKHSITLSTTEPNNEVGVIKIRQADERTQILDVQITENGVPKSYQGLAVYFCAKLGQTAGLGIIEQKLNPEELTSPANGKLEYTMRAEDWQILGRQKGYFSFRKMKDGHEFVEQFTTRDFTFDVIKSVFSEGLTEVKKDGSTYVWTIEELKRLYKEYIASGKTDWEEFVEQNKEIIESVDPGGEVLSELIRTRKPAGADVAYKDVPERLDKQIGLNSDFREFELEESFMKRVYNEQSERGVNVKWFGAKGDGIADDAPAFLLAAEFANQHKKTIYVPNGKYLFGNNIDFTNLARNVDNLAEDYSFRIVFRGEDVSKTFLIGDIGLKKLFVYNPIDKKNTRSFTFENFKIRSKEPYDNLSLRADLKAFELLASPYTQFKNIDLLGIREGIHMQNCWFSTFENISGSRISKGIFIDGTNDENTGIGHADFIYMRDVRFGTGIDQFGIKFLGSKACKIVNFDSEAGYAGPAIIFEGCHNIDVDTFYIENYINAPVFEIGGREILNSLTDFSTEITLRNGHVLNQQTPFIRFKKGVERVSLEKTRFVFNYDRKTPITSQQKNMFSFPNLGAELGKWFRYISVLDNQYYSKDNYAPVYLQQFSQVFLENGQSYVNGANISYYNPTYEKGTIVYQLDKTLDYESFFVESEGSFGTLTGVSGSITSGSNVAILNDVSQIVPGTWINIGSMARVKILAKNPEFSTITLGDNATQSITNAIISYALPVLKYNHVARYGTTINRPQNVIAGTMYFDSQLAKPIWWTGSKWVNYNGDNV